MAKCPVKVPTLPFVYMRLLEVMNDPHSSSADVGAVISDDSGLTARLLRLMNSVFYEYPPRIESVKQGLWVVGTQQLHDLALATSVIGMFQDVAEDLVDMNTFWHHSLACGVCSRAIATDSAGEPGPPGFDRVRRRLNIAATGRLHYRDLLTVELRSRIHATTYRVCCPRRIVWCGWMCIESVRS